MLLHEISPFVRFADEQAIPARKKAMFCSDCRMILITHGTGRAYIDKKSYELSPGTAFLWQPLTLYRFTLNGEVRAVIIDFDLISNGENTEEILPLITKRGCGYTEKFPVISFSDATVLNSPIVMQNAHFLREDMLLVANELKNRSPLSLANASAYLKLCITKAISHLMYEHEDAEIVKKIAVVTEYIHKNFARQLSNEELAFIAGYHPYYLNRIFKFRKGCTLHQYILNYRLSTAVEYLLSTKQNISEIAEKVGFNSQIAFINAFKKRYNLTPTQFRNKTL